MRAVLALGGNALLCRGERGDIATQRRNAARAAAALAGIINSHETVLTHGNGPQIGLLALQAAQGDDPAPPLDVLGAESEGLIGYLLEQELIGACPERSFATLLTLVETDPADPAFAAPAKPIGPVYPPEAWRRLAAKQHWRGAPENAGMRRVVPSPAPRKIIELDVIRRLLRGGITPICAGGGGVPVARRGDGGLEGVEAVIDKDLTSARLAIDLNADALVLLTDVDAVYDGWGTPGARAIRDATPEAIRAHALPAGSMGPKAEAAAWFAERTGHAAFIGSLDDADAILRGASGTRIAL